MTGYKKINMETWARREHYEYYTKQLKVEYNHVLSCKRLQILPCYDLSCY